MTEQPTSPTSMLWAYQLRRENKQLHDRIDALELQNTALTKKANDCNRERATLKAKVEILEASQEEHDADRKQVEILTQKVSTLEKRLWDSINGDCQATTVEEGVVARCAPARRRVGSKKTLTEEDQVLQRKINTLQQGGKGTREYIESAESTLQVATKENELVVVRAFVLGISDEARKQRTESRLGKKGWTWAVAKEAFEESEQPASAKRKAPRRYIIPPEEVKQIRTRGITPPDEGKEHLFPD